MEGAEVPERSGKPESKRTRSQTWRSLRGASFAILLFAILLSAAATLSAQQPGQDAREIPPTPGVTPIDTPATARTSVTPLRHTTPMTTRTPAAGVGTLDVDNGRPRGHVPSEQPDPRNAVTWTLFGILVVALGFVSVRMLEHRVDPSGLGPQDPDVPPSSYPYPYTYP